MGGTDTQSLETWAERAARVGGLSEEMDSTRAEPMGAYAVLHKVKLWEGTVIPLGLCEESHLTYPFCRMLARAS